MNEYRHDTVCQMRVRNEARWIARSLDRTFQVAETVVIFDDGSTDNTEYECYTALGKDVYIVPQRYGWVGYNWKDCGLVCLHFLHSPFAGADIIRPKLRVSEVRDKNFLWEYCKANIIFRYVLCLDGDEMLSNEAVAKFSQAWDYLNNDTDILSLCFVYLWDSEDRQRVDGIYGNRADGLKTLQFPRFFTIQRVESQSLFDMRFAWLGTRGGFHCGSVPRESFVRRDGKGPVGGTFAPPVVHFGYLNEEQRQEKFEFYNTIDPNNEVEGHYSHIIGEPNIHASGPVQLDPWEDKKVKPVPVREIPIPVYDKQAMIEQWRRERESQEIQWAKEDEAFGEHWAAQQAEHRRQVKEQMQKRREEWGRDKNGI